MWRCRSVSDCLHLMRLLKQWNYKLPEQHKHEFIACFVILGLKEVVQLLAAPARCKGNTQPLSHGGLRNPSEPTRTESTQSSVGTSLGPSLLTFHGLERLWA